RVYSDQFKIYYGVEVPLWIDARPYDGPDMNQPFPLRADVQGLNPGQTISAQNCKFVFQAQNGYGTDGGYRDVGLRDFYNWTLTLSPQYAQFTDGSYQKSGVFDLTQGQNFETPYFNLYNLPSGVSPLQFDLTPAPIPEPDTLVLVVVGCGVVGVVGRRRRRRLQWSGWEA
ncbi:MAG: PEP-CTERM sorting domain-containing protein, partial [Verrucomicrobiae bacterium]|nr:PEP-CTERM sorting domain-containing protein [Verrucomicrobiae bacterium]